ncbi:sulfurtransferase [Silvimonas sp. JCM 19000]
MFPLLSVDQLASALTDPKLVVVDCRNDLLSPDSGRAAWQAGHIPNAIYLHVDADLSGPRNGANGRHPLPAPLWLAARLGSLGIGNDSRVVAYDAAGGMYAARLWWLLGWLGHDNVQVLDGGFPAWQAAGRPISEERPVPLAAVFVPHVRSNRVVNATQVMGNLRESAFQVVDARSPSRFRGEGETMDPVGGHIPGALNRFYADNLVDGHFKPIEQLQQEWRELLGAIPPADVVHQCGSGVTACHNLLAMAVAGYNGGRLYAGSWSEWVADPARPVATQ